MNYKYFDVPWRGKVQRNIIVFFENGSFMSFLDVESNNSLERCAYLDWVAQGNITEEWQPE